MNQNEMYNIYRKKKKRKRNDFTLTPLRFYNKL